MQFYLFLWSLIHIIISYALICSSLTQSLPRVRTELQNPIVYPVGVNVQISCPAYDDETELIFFEWSRGVNQPIEESPRYRLTIKGVLKIKSAVIEDSGVYYCKAINGFGFVTTNVTLLIVPNEDLLALNSPLDNLSPRDHSDYLKFDSDFNLEYNYKKAVNKVVHDPSRPIRIERPVGYSVTLNCNARHVRWNKNGEPLSAKHLNHGSNKNRGLLSLHKLRVQDSGNYTCIGSDRFGPLTNSFQLFVYDKKIPELTGFSPINTTVNVGDIALFNCKVKSDVKPHIQWLKDYKSAKDLDLNESIKLGLLRINNSYYRVLKSTQVIDIGNGLYYNHLKIENTKLSDSGNYICLAGSATNPIGYTFKGTHLNVLPVIQSAEDTTDANAFKLNMTTVFWIIVGSVSILFLLLSYILCQIPVHSNSSNDNNESLDIDLNRNKYKNKEHISKEVNTCNWIQSIGEQNLCLNPLYNCAASNQSNHR